MKSKILVFTSSFLRWKNDYRQKDFLYMLTKNLSHYFNVYVIAPKGPKSKKQEIVEGITIFRYRQFFIKKIGIAYGSGIISNLKKNPFLYLFVPFFLFYQFITLAKVVQQEQISVIHAHWIIPQGFIAVLYKLIINKNIKILATIHGSDIWGFNNIFGTMIKKLVLSHIAELTVVSNTIKNEAIKLGYKKHIYVYPMGVDTQIFKPFQKNYALKKQLHIRGDLILFVGSCIENKGIRFLIEAMEKIVSVYPQTKLLVIGEGNLKQEMMLLSQKLGIDKNVLFLGYVKNENLPKYFASADLFILPSLSEGFPLVVSEALSSAVLIITSDLPVFKDLSKKKLLVTVPQKNSLLLSKKVTEYLSKKKKSENMRKNERTYAVTNLDWNIVTKNYKTLLAQLLNN